MSHTHQLITWMCILKPKPGSPAKFQRKWLRSMTITERSRIVNYLVKEANFSEQAVHVKQLRAFVPQNNHATNDHVDNSNSQPHADDTNAKLNLNDEASDSNETTITNSDINEPDSNTMKTYTMDKSGE